MYIFRTEVARDATKDHAVADCEVDNGSETRNYKECNHVEVGAISYKAKQVSKCSSRLKQTAMQNNAEILAKCDLNFEM